MRMAKKIGVSKLINAPRRLNSAPVRIKLPSQGSRKPHTIQATARTAAGINIIFGAS